MAKTKGETLVEETPETLPAPAVALAIVEPPAPLETPAAPLETPPAAPVEPAPVEPAPAVPVPPVTIQTPLAPAQLFPGFPSPFEPAQPATPTDGDNGKQGCQCDKCKAEGGNKDKRGRHHKICPCPICAKARGETPKPSAAIPGAPAGETPNPFLAIGQAAEVAVDDGKKFAVLGEMTFDMSAGILCMVFGPEWQPRNKDEREQVAAAIANYYKHKGIEDLPPGALLAAVVLAYAAPRMAAPSTKSKLVLAWHWVKVKASSIFKRKPHA